MLNLIFERHGTDPPFLAAAYYVPTWVKFTGSAGVKDIIILPVTETLQDPNAAASLRPQDLARLNEIPRELAELIYCPDMTA
jgi:hypothetical protein